MATHPTKAKKKRNLKCDQCGEGFRSARKNARFCRRACTLLYWNNDYKAKCRAGGLALGGDSGPGLFDRLRFLFRPAPLGWIISANKAMAKELIDLQNAPPPPPAPVEPEPVLPISDQNILKLRLFGAYDKIKKVEHELENAAKVADFRGERVGILEDKVSALSLDNKEYLRRLKADDEVIKSLSAQLKDSVTKSVYSTVIATIRDEYKESLEKARVQLRFGNHEATLHSPTASALGV